MIDEYASSHPPTCSDAYSDKVDVTNELAPKVFLSHSHVDKLVARCLYRRLNAHGIKVWLDERELKVGAALTPSISAQIQNVDILLIVASQASAKSIWVGLEIEVAYKHGKAIIPLLLDPVAEHQRFKEYLGVDAMSKQDFADVVQELMHNLYRPLQLELLPPDSTLLTRGLRELAIEEPDLAPLILGCLESTGLHEENEDMVFNVAFHALDDALNSLYDLRPSECIARHAAEGFFRAGAGRRALSLWIDASGDGKSPLLSAVGRGVLDRSLISTAIDLLESCEPPNNHALCKFIHYNSSQLDDDCRRSVIRLVTWPVRTNTERMGDELGWVAFKHFPDANEIQHMWNRWVKSGVFDANAAGLARYLADAHNEGLEGWGPVNETHRRHIRDCLRSGDQEKVFIAIDHVIAAADNGAPVLAILLREAEHVSSTVEWNEWRAREPDTVEWMKWYLFNIVKEATADRNWLRAWNGAEQIVSSLEQRLRLLKQDAGGDNGTDGDD